MVVGVVELVVVVVVVVVIEVVIEVLVPVEVTETVQVVMEVVVVVVVVWWGGGRFKGGRKGTLERETLGTAIRGIHPLLLSDTLKQAPL